MKCTVEHPSGGTANAANGVEKVALSDAKIASHIVPEVTPEPMTGPLAATRMGLGKLMNLSKVANEQKKDFFVKN